MSYLAVLDVSSIVWDREDYLANTDVYYELKNDIITFIDRVAVENPTILIRSELLSLMCNGFPFEMFPQEFWEFGNLVYEFLANLGADLVTYEQNKAAGITSVPNIIKSHFPNNVKEELNYLIDEMHLNNEIDKVYFTFKYLWGNNENLVTNQVSGGAKSYETIISNADNSLDDFFGRFKRVFEHNPKHHINQKKDAKLRCYNGVDILLPQQYLDEAIKENRRYYYFDKVHDVFIVFPSHLGNKYHGYEEDEINNIPPRVRRIFKK